LKNFTQLKLFTMAALEAATQQACVRTPEESLDLLDGRVKPGHVELIWIETVKIFGVSREVSSPG